MEEERRSPGRRCDASGRQSNPTLKRDATRRGEAARDDERPAFQHGNGLSSLAIGEHIAWTQAAKRKKTRRVTPDTFPYHRPKPFYLNRRAVGWLKFLYRKCVTEDDWSEDGDPRGWWDRLTFAPMSSFPRFDLHESSYFILLAAEQTPAWSEAYESVMDGLASRYVTFWGAVDWMTQFGHDPDRDSYPMPYRDRLIPSSLFGTYDAPGWTGNGVMHPDRPEDDVVTMDPIEAHGMLFYKGWMNLVLGIRNRVSHSADRGWSWPSLDKDQVDKRWNYDSLAKKLESQFLANRGQGLH